MDDLKKPIPDQISDIPDCSEDEVAPEAIGTDNLPPGYFRSLRFIGTVVAVTLMNISLYIGYVLPVCCQIPLGRAILSSLILCTGEHLDHHQYRSRP